MRKYDLVRVVSCEYDSTFNSGIGIITETHKDIDDKILYNLIFIGKKLNKLSDSYGGIMFYENELEGI